MEGKTDKQILFDVQLSLVEDKKGILSAKDRLEVISVAAPPEFGGEGKSWTPEHLFLSAISSCFMTTYLAFAKKFRFEVSHFECNTIGQIKIVDGKYKFTHINLFPKVYIADETLREKAIHAMEKTHEYCLVSNSVNAAIFYHSEVLTDPLPRFKSQNAQKTRTTFSVSEARDIGGRLGIDFTKYNFDEFRRGLEVELEHGKRISETNVTNDNEYMTGKIAWAHLHEIPDYYTRLDKIEKEADGQIQNNEAA
jgi:peroxiredoxin-like protein